MKKSTLIWISTLVLTLLGLGLYISPKSDTLVAQYEPRTDFKKHIGDWNGAQNLYYQFRRNPNTGEVSFADILNAKNTVDAKAQFGKTNSAFSWEEVGPDNVGGRTLAILVDNTTSDGSRVYAGSASGGLFVSDNFGNNWRPINNTQDNLCISSLAQGPDGTIWVATGSSFDNMNTGGEGNSGFIGGGLFKLIPGGSSLTKVSTASPVAGNNASEEWCLINSVRVDQTSGRIYAGQNKGLRISDDGGNTWLNPIKNSSGNPVISVCHDIEVADDGTVLAILSGTLYRSPSGNDDTYTYVGSANGFTAGTRVELSISPANNDVVYAVMCNTFWNFSGLYKSTDRGQNWVKIPMLSSFNPFNLGANAQGFYDMVCAADPLDENSVYIGGIDLYKYNGNVTHISQWDAGSGGNAFSPYYVHADQHSFAYNPKNKHELYFGNDGGVFKTYNQGEFFYAANRGYNVTQFYSVAYTQEGYMLGGAQDNGSIQVLGLNSIYPQEGQEFSGGDGFDCDVSQITRVLFGTVYNGEIRKYKANGGGGDYKSFNDANFYTCIKLWESYTDATSKDTITFNVEDGTTKNVLRRADGIGKSFSGVLNKSQAALNFVIGSVQFKAGAQVLTDVDGDGNLSGNGIGTFNYSTGAYSITFTSAPPNLTDVSAYFQGSVDAGATLNLKSNTPEVKLRGNDFTVPYTAPSFLPPGSIIRIQDPVQSLLAFGASTGKIYLNRKSLRDTTGVWLEVPYSTNQGVKCLEFSKDGNHLFVGTFSGNLYRLSGLNNVYDAQSAKLVANGGQVTVSKIFGASGRVVLGVSLNPNDNNKIAISLSGYGQTNYVYFSNQALTATNGSNTFTSIQGDLPAMPVYDILLSNDNDETILAATEFGVYSTTTFTSSTWTDANGNLPRVPVFAIRQQTAPWEVSTNGSTVYLGTHGRGFWRTGSIVGINEPQKIDQTFASGLVVYPNPAYNRDQITLKIQTSKSSLAQVRLFDLSGKMVYNGQEQLQVGSNNISINIQSLSAGTYFVALQNGQELKTGKFVVSK